MHNNYGNYFMYVHKTTYIVLYMHVHVCMYNKYGDYFTFIPHYYFDVIITIVITHASTNEFYSILPEGGIPRISP